MKILLATLLSCTLLFSLTGCSRDNALNGITAEPAESIEQSVDSDEDLEEPDLRAEPPPENTKSLVVYFSATGNTKEAAEALAELQGADLYEIVPEQPYTEEDLNYNDRSTRASAEQNDDTARPAISGSIDNIGDYDVIYVGFPIWWGDMPRILYTFFDTYDLTGKTIAPFCTSGGSGISGAAQSITEIEPSAVVTDGLRVNASAGAADFLQWLTAIGLLAQE